MNRKIDFYIFKTVLASYIIVTIIFSVLFFIFTYLAQVTNVDNVSNWDAIMDTLFQLPAILYTLMPACAMVGSLMALSLLANNSEIIVLRASGLAVAQISKGVVLVGLIATVITVSLGGYIGPKLEKLSDDRVTMTQNLWLKTNDGYVNISRINPEKGTASNIRKFVMDDYSLDEVRLAKKAVYKSDKEATVYDISKVNFPNEGQKKLDVTHQLKKDQWVDPLSLSIANIITSARNEYLTIDQLIHFTFSEKGNENIDPSIPLKFWQEVFQPISLMLLMLLSVPLSIGSTRSSSLILKLLFGAFIGFMFFIINQIFGPMALMMKWPPIIGGMMPTLAVLILLIVLFIRARE